MILNIMGMGKDGKIDNPRNSILLARKMKFLDSV